MKGEAAFEWEERRERQVAFCSKLVVDVDVDKHEDKTLLLFDINKSNTETADNIIQIRTQKYKQWVSDELDERTYIGGSKEEFIKKRIVIRLESLSMNSTDDLEHEHEHEHDDPEHDLELDLEHDDPEHDLGAEKAKAEKDKAVTKFQDEIFGSIMDGSCVKRLEEFEGVVQHIETGGFDRHGHYMPNHRHRHDRDRDRDHDHHLRHHHHEDRNDRDHDGSASDKEGAKDLLEMYTKEDIQFVLSQLDLDLERKLGYDYSHVLDGFTN